MKKEMTKEELEEFIKDTPNRHNRYVDKWLKDPEVRKFILRNYGKRTIKTKSE